MLDGIWVLSHKHPWRRNKCLGFIVCSKLDSKKKLDFCIKSLMNGIAGSPAGDAIPAQVPIYRDIYDYFMFIRSQMDVRNGTYLFNVRKKVYCEQINNILACTSQLSIRDSSCFVNFHELKLEGALLDLECEFIRTIHYNLQISVVSVWPFICPLFLVLV